MPRGSAWAAIGAVALLSHWGCAQGETPAGDPSPETPGSATVEVPAEAPAATAAASADPEPVVDDRPKLGALKYATLVYEKPNRQAERIGYLRVGALVPRSEEPVGKSGCKGGWYRIEPRGYVCAGEDATLDLDHPLLRASKKRPRLDRPLPYRYGFVRSVLPLYLRVPTAKQQFDSEFKLQEHLDWYKEHKEEIQRADLGAPDVPVDPIGRVLPGKRVGELGHEKNSTELGLGELFGGNSDDDPWPFWLQGSERTIPNISGFEVPASSVFADRARRHTGLAFIGSFATDDIHLRRRFGITTDLRLAPTSKVKPDSASPWHGVELGDEYQLPLAFVRFRGVDSYRLTANGAESSGKLERRSVQRLTGKARHVDGHRYVQLQDGGWARVRDLGLVVAPSKWPLAARRGEKWIQVDLSEQTLVLWKGKEAEFATLVSTGRPAIGDPDKTNATVRGVFRVYAKHVSATMDSDEGMGKKQNANLGLKPGDPGYVPTKGDGIYGVTLRRGHGLFKLRDVPHIQYFHKNYALHAAYWHDVFGVPRSHGCINLAPADSLRVYHWTEPKVPEGWHMVREDGTTIIVHQ